VSFILVTNLKILNKNTRICTLSFKFYVNIFGTIFRWNRYKMKNICTVPSIQYYTLFMQTHRRQKEPRNSCHQQTESYLNSDKELFKPSKMLVKIIWRLPLQSEWTDLRQEVSLHGTCEREDRGETTRRSKSCPSRWWNEELPEWHYKRKLPANTSTDISRVEAASSTKTGIPWPHSSKNTWSYIVSFKIGEATPSWSEPPWCPAKKSELCQLVHAPCCSES